ncbi:hypothetical protein ACFY5D_00915 [Paeniglutamicibacter sp. NPDC012692]|uniref:hypothetical protein n=1 Tax=Paeniglutamicibacter sp. NPDC012692 TaxID=3364388 RepID=UPI0036AB5828
MEWLLWLVGVPVALLLLLWAASKFSFPERPAGTNGSSGFFDALNDVYNPSSTAARIERDEQKRRIVESARGQDRDPLTGFHLIEPSDPEDGSDGGSDDTPSGDTRTPR